MLLVKSEYKTFTGKLDIALLPSHNHSMIILKYNKKLIGIEIKSGRWVGATTFNQIERYLFDVDQLLIVRVPTEDVVIVDRGMIERTLLNGLWYLEAKN